MEMTSLFLLLCIVGMCYGETCSSCKMPKLDPCQKAAIRRNQDYINTLTTENVEQFRVEIYKEPIMVLSNEQHAFVKKYYRNFFIPTKEVVKVEENTTVTIDPDDPNTRIETHNVTNGVVVDSNGTCTTVTRTSEAGNGYIAISTTTKCQGTDEYGREWKRTQSGTKYIRSRKKRQVGQQFVTRVCEGVSPPLDRVLYSVESKTGDAVQLVPLTGTSQNQGDEDCVLSRSSDSSIECRRILLDVPTISFRLARHKKLDIINVKLPHCVAYQKIN